MLKGAALLLLTAMLLDAIGFDGQWPNGLGISGGAQLDWEKAQADTSFQKN